MTCSNGGIRFKITTLDAPVVASAYVLPLNFSNDLPDVQKGVHASLSTMREERTTCSKRARLKVPFSSKG